MKDITELRLQREAYETMKATHRELMAERETQAATLRSIDDKLLRCETELSTAYTSMNADVKDAAVQLHSAIDTNGDKQADLCEVLSALFCNSDSKLAWSLVQEMLHNFDTSISVEQIEKCLFDVLQ